MVNEHIQQGLFNDLKKDYLDLLQGIANNDAKIIDKLCEGNLSRAFNSGLQEIKTDFKKIELVGQESAFPLSEQTKKVKFECVDCSIHLGPEINREANRLNNLVWTSSDLNSYRNYYKSRSEDRLPMIFQIALKVVTPIKLNVVTWQDQHLIEEPTELETTFVIVEWYLHIYPKRVLPLLYHAFMTEVLKRYKPEDIAQFTDFDDCLKGNPFI